MTDNLQKFISVVSDNDALKAKVLKIEAGSFLKEDQIDQLIALAKDNGVELTADDFNELPEQTGDEVPEKVYCLVLGVYSN